MRAFICSVVSMAWLGGAGLASADVVGPPPDRCPEGTTGQSCHGGAYCAPRTCTTDAECGAGAACAERTQCITRIGCAGLLPPDADPADYEVDRVEGTCPGDCTGECRTARVCVATTRGGGADSDGGCCTTAPGRPRSAPPALALLLVPVLIIRASAALRARRPGPR